MFKRAGNNLVFVKLGTYGNMRFTDCMIITREQVTVPIEEATVARYSSEGCGE